MNLPTIPEALALLEANPAIAAEYAAATPGKSRREAVEATLEAFACKARENEAMRAKLIATRQKIAALEKAKAALPQLKAQVAAAKATPKAPATPPAAVKLTTAAEFQTPELRMTRSDFDTLNPSDRMRFFKQGGKLI